VEQAAVETEAELIEVLWPVRLELLILAVAEVAVDMHHLRVPQAVEQLEEVV
jgi:hypothetical protein|tara:strand:- start:66 stop:221 length:156 start_codon:yes stop_codon:yes gene_type:complete